MKWISRKMGIWLMIIGFLVAVPINILLIEFVSKSIDVDIFGALIFVIGLIITIAGWKK
jgi:hypothetical protein